VDARGHRLNVHRAGARSAHGRSADELRAAGRARDRPAHGLSMDDPLLAGSTPPSRNYGPANRLPYITPTAYYDLCHFSGTVRHRGIRSKVVAKPRVVRSQLVVTQDGYFWMNWSMLSVLTSCNSSSDVADSTS
jgi:hypothetical protein